MKKTISFGLTTRAKIIILIASLLLIVNIIQPWKEVSIRSLYIPFLLIGLVISGWIVNRARGYAFERLEIKRIIPPNVYENETINVKIIIKNPTPIGLYNIVIEEHYPETLSKVEGFNTGVIQIPPKSEVQVNYKLKAKGIGRHEFGSIILRKLGIIGFYYTEATYSNIESSFIGVMPSLPKINIEEALARGYKLELGAQKVPHSGFSTEFRDIREYVPGDEIRRIDWKATAKLNKLMIREYELERKNNIVLILDLSKNMFIGELGLRKIDHASRTIAYIINYAISRRDNVGLIILSGYGIEVIPVTMASETILQNTLRKLSNITVYPPADEDREWSIDELGIGLERLKLRDKTLFILISDLETPGIIDNIVELSKILRGMRHELVVVSPLTVLFEARMLKGIDAAIYKVIGYISMQERKKMIDKLFKAGVPVINVGPRDLIPYIMLKIEEYRRMIIV